ncbi:hypothetical protein LINPERHAP2_LOCUS30352, partial [Linum perenne]
GFSNILTVGCLIPYALYQLFFAVENLTNSKALIHINSWTGVSYRS